MKAKEIVVGERFGFLTVVCEVPRASHKNRRVLMRCDCGTEKEVRFDLVATTRTKRTVSCGCYGRKVSSELRTRLCTTHGMSKTPLYAIWSSMKSRCTNPANENWHNYGGRGIKVCDEWMRSFDAFASHVGPKPEGMSLDRKNNEGNYEPGNTRWATSVEQGRNQRRSVVVEVAGMTMPLAEAADMFGVPTSRLYSSLLKNGSLARSIGATRVSKAQAAAAITSVTVREAV